MEYLKSRAIENRCGDVFNYLCFHANCGILNEEIKCSSKFKIGNFEVEGVRVDMRIASIESALGMPGTRQVFITPLVFAQFMYAIDIGVRQLNIYHNLPISVLKSFSKHFKVLHCKKLNELQYTSAFYINATVTYKGVGMLGDTVQYFENNEDFIKTATEKYKEWLDHVLNSTPPMTKTSILDKTVAHSLIKKGLTMC